MYSIVEDDQPPIPEGCSPLLQDFLAQCFNKDPTKRPSADVLCEHPWLKKNWGAHKVGSLRHLRFTPIDAYISAGTTTAG